MTQPFAPMPQPAAAFRAFLATALPVRSWLRTPALRSRPTLVLVLAVAYPLIACWLYSAQFRPVPVGPGGALDPSAQAALSHDLQWLDWPSVLYFGGLWLLALWLLIKPRVRPWQAGSIVVIALFIQTPMAIWLETVFPSSTGNPLTAIVVVGGSEELTKMVTVIVALVAAATLRRTGAATWLDLSPRSFAFLGALSGVVFGCSEAVTYIVDSQVDTLQGTDSVVGFTSEYFFRLIQDPIAHAMWAAISCYFVGIAVTRVRRTGRPLVAGLAENWTLLVAGLTVVAVLHGLNDWVSPLPLLQATVDAVSILLLICYVRCGDHVADVLSGRPGSRWTYQVGDAVLISPRPQLPVRAAGKTVRWTRQRQALAGRIATVVWTEPDRLARIDLDGGAQTWPVDWLDPLPAVHQAVRIPAALQARLGTGGQDPAWTPPMDAMLGAQAIVVQVYADATVQLDRGPSGITWASRWLERVPGPGVRYPQPSGFVAAPSPGRADR